MTDFYLDPIRNNRELRLRYDLLVLCEKGLDRIIDNLECVSIELLNKRKDIIKYIKRSIRNYFKECNNQPYITRYILADYDEYLELIEVNESVSNIDKWFDDNIRLEYTPSMYDCTGQHFTCWYKSVFRRGKWFIYHKVAVDV